MIDSHLFRGICIAHLKRTSRFTEEEMRTVLLPRMNQFIRDQSPQPFSIRKEGSGEGENGGVPIPSLGPYGWVGFYEKRVGNVVATERTYCILVVSSMDEKKYEDMYKMARETLHGRVSVREAMEHLQPYREDEVLKRRQILAELAMVVGEETVEATERSSIPFDMGKGGDGGSLRTIPSTLLDWLPPAPIRIPCSYMVPRRTPRDVPDIPPGCGHFMVGAGLPVERAERFPIRVLPDLDCFLDDMSTTTTNTKQVIRYTGCTDVTVAAISLRGPLHSISIVRPSTETGFTTFAKTFYAHPAQAPQGDVTGNLAEVTVHHTWEDATITHNRLVESEFPLQLYVDDTATTTYLTAAMMGGTHVIYDPICVRVSCRDSNGLVYETSSKKRMSGFCAQEWDGV
jgi:hypothetical protein